MRVRLGNTIIQDTASLLQISVYLTGSIGIHIMTPPLFSHVTLSLFGQLVVQVHTVVLCVGPFLCRFSITCSLHKTDWANGAWTKNIPPRVSHFSALV